MTGEVKFSLKYSLLPHQYELISTNHKLAGIIGGRGCGKSRVLSLIAACNLIEGKKSLVFAQNFRSLSLNLFSEIRARLDEMSIQYTFNKSTMLIKIDRTGGLLIGATYENTDACRGLTEVQVAIFDEICLAPADLLATVGPCLRGDFEPRIYFGSTPRLGSTWNAWLLNGEKDGTVKIFRAKMTDNTFLSQESIDLAVSAITDSKLREQELNGAILDGADESCICSVLDFNCSLSDEDYSEDDLYYFGFDASGTGHDLNVLTLRRGLKLFGIWSWSRITGREFFTELRKICAEYGISKDKIGGINLDMAYSQSVYEVLCENGYTEITHQIAFAGRATKTGYANLRAEMYFELVKKIRAGMRIDDELVQQELLNTHFMLNNRDEIILQPKEDIKFLLKRSPDRTDAIALSCLEEIDGKRVPVTITPEQEQKYIKLFLK